MTAEEKAYNDHYKKFLSEKVDMDKLNAHKKCNGILPLRYKMALLIAFLEFLQDNPIPVENDMRGKNRFGTDYVPMTTDEAKLKNRLNQREYYKKNKEKILERNKEKYKEKYEGKKRPYTPRKQNQKKVALFY